MRSAADRALEHKESTGHFVRIAGWRHPWCMTCGLRFPESVDVVEMTRRRPRRSSARTLIKGSSGAVIPHGMRLQGPPGRVYVIVWPLWRRILYWLGVERAAIYSKPEGVECTTREERT